MGCLTESQNRISLLSSINTWTYSNHLMHSMHSFRTHTHTPHCKAAAPTKTDFMEYDWQISHAAVEPKLLYVMSVPQVNTPLLFAMPCQLNWVTACDIITRYVALEESGIIKAHNMCIITWLHEIMLYAPWPCTCACMPDQFHYTRRKYVTSHEVLLIYSLL